MANRVQIPFGFQMPLSGYMGATNGATTTTIATTALEPVVGSAVTITDRNTGSPTTVYSAFTGSGTITSVITDANGNVPGYVNEGSYTLVVAPITGFSGATISWEAVRGDGVGNIAPGAVNMSALSAIVAQALCPVGSIQEFGGTSLPNGFLFCDGSVVSSTTYPALASVLGTTWNIGGEGTGNFRLPDLRRRMSLGKAASGTGSTLGAYGGSIDHTHSIPSLSIPSLAVPSQGAAVTVNNHTHTLSGAGGAAISVYPDTFFGEKAVFMWQSNGPSAAFTGWHYFGIPGGPSVADEAFVPDSTTIPVPALTGRTDAGGTQTAAGATYGGASTPSSTGTGISGTNNPPYAVVNKIIKHDYS